MSRKLLVALLLAAAVGSIIVFQLSKPRAIYSMSVAGFVKRGLPDQPARVHGTLVNGTLCTITADCGYRFTIQESGQELSVEYPECVVSDALRELPGWEVHVTVEGERCQGCHDFKATSVAAGVRTKYELNGPLSRPAPPLPLCKDLPRM